MRRSTIILLPTVFVLALSLAATSRGQGKDPYLAGPWFTNVAKQVGLAGVPAKDCILVDLNGDGYEDLCLDHHRFFLSEKGRKFKEVKDVGIEFPTVKVVPMTKDGKPDPAKAKEKVYIPQYLYFADVNNDGAEDAIFGVHSNWQRFDEKTERFVDVPGCDPGVRSSVWLNDGKGHFTRAPDSQFSSKSAAGPAMALAAIDYDHDGNLDLYEGREYRKYGILADCGVDRLWKGDGKGGFTDVTAKAGMMTVPEPGGPRSSRPTYGVTTADVNNDGWADLLQCCYGRQWNYLWRNNENGTFSDIGRETGFAGDDITDGRYPKWVNRPAERPFRSNGNTFDCAVGDFDNDGDMDLFLGEIKHAWAGRASDPPSLLINQFEQGQMRFKRVPVMQFLPPRGSRSPMMMNYGDLHVAFADVDNDGRLDLLIASGDYPDGQFLRLYRQRSDGSFEEDTLLSGFHWEGCGDISIGDFDRDGDPDILIGRSFVRLSQKYRDEFMHGLKVNEVGLFRNDIANRTGNHFLNVRLRGTTANRTGIGARITVVANGETQIRELRAGSGLSNHEDPPEAIFGLGKATKVDELIVRWPNRALTTSVYKDIPADRFAVVTEKGIELSKAK